VRAEGLTEERVGKADGWGKGGQLVAGWPLS